MASSGCGNQPYRIRVGSQLYGPSLPARDQLDGPALAARLGIAMPGAKMIKQYLVSEFEGPSASQLFVNDSLP